MIRPLRRDGVSEDVELAVKFLLGGLVSLTVGIVLLAWSRAWFVWVSLGLGGALVAASLVGFWYVRDVRRESVVTRGTSRDREESW